MRGDVRHSYEGTTGDSASNAAEGPGRPAGDDHRRHRRDRFGITAYQRHYQNPMTSSIRFTPRWHGLQDRRRGHRHEPLQARSRQVVEPGPRRDQPGRCAWNVGGSGRLLRRLSGLVLRLQPQRRGAFFRRTLRRRRWRAQLLLGLALRAGRQPAPARPCEDSDGRRLAAHGAMGDLRVWVSNHGGLDAGAMADSASDDADRYLSYAAYGLFVYTDYIDEYPRPGFLQGWHFGYDAFRDAANMRTSDVATSIAATFEGRTMGMILHPRSNSVGIRNRAARRPLHPPARRRDAQRLHRQRRMHRYRHTHRQPTGSRAASTTCRRSRTASGRNTPSSATRRRAHATHAEHRDQAGGGRHRGRRQLFRHGGFVAGRAVEPGRIQRRPLRPQGQARNRRLVAPRDRQQPYQNRHLVAFGSFGACQAEHCRVAAPSN